MRRVAMKARTLLLLVGCGASVGGACRGVGPGVGDRAPAGDSSTGAHTGDGGAAVETGPVVETAGDSVSETGGAGGDSGLAAHRSGLLPASQADPVWLGGAAAELGGSLAILDSDEGTLLVAGARGADSVSAWLAPWSAGAAPLWTLQGEATGDSFGKRVALGERSGAVVLLVAASAVGSGAGRVYLVDDVLAGAAASLLTVDGESGAALGVGLAMGDGLLALGGPGAAGGGAVWLLSADATGAVAVGAAALAVLSGEASADFAGQAVAPPADLDGDGVPDAVVGAWGSDRAGVNAGAVYVVAGPQGGSVSLADADAILTGPVRDDGAGMAVASADVDGDGHGDVLVGGAGYDAAKLSVGAVWWVRGPVVGAVDLAAADARWVGTTTDERVGWAVGLPDDLDGDGAVDVLLGAIGSALGGATSGVGCVLWAPSAGTATLEGMVESGAALCAAGDAAGDQAGYAVAGSAAMGALAVGAPEADDEAGTVSVFQLMGR